MTSTNLSQDSHCSRREMVASLAGGLGLVGLSGMLQGQTVKASSPVLDFPAKTKSVIFLFMTGGPSHLDLLDPKPALHKYAGQRPKSTQLRTERVTGGLLPSPWKFKSYGQSGTEVSELLPGIGSCVDDICLIRSMYTFNPTHTPARNLMHSGNIASTRPTLGAWASYGLGTENEDLPAFVVLSHPRSGKLWRAGFLPSEHQGTLFDQQETSPDKMIRYLRNAHLDRAVQQKQVHFLQQLNQVHLRARDTSPFLEARIKAMETAFRMQFAASEAFDTSHEPQYVRSQYGENPFANSCLLARRLVERGVRYIHVFSGPGQPWDDHDKIKENLEGRCPDMDTAVAALIRDLKQRGLLDETLVVWTGEFGRTPVSEAGDGRDHNPYGFSVWMAGGGVKGGMVLGSTDEFGFQAVENRINVHDLHATILHLMGLDHEKLTYRYAGRDFRLTDVEGRVVNEILT